MLTDSLKIDLAKFSPGQADIKLTVKIDIGVTDPRDSMISYIYFISQKF